MHDTPSRDAQRIDFLRMNLDECRQTLTVLREEVTRLSPDETASVIELIEHLLSAALLVDGASQ